MDVVGCIFMVAFILLLTPKLTTLYSFTILDDMMCSWIRIFLLTINKNLCWVAFALRWEQYLISLIFSFWYLFTLLRRHIIFSWRLTHKSWWQKIMIDWPLKNRSLYTLTRNREPLFQKNILPFWQTYWWCILL